MEFRLSEMWSHPVWARDDGWDLGRARREPFETGPGNPRRVSNGMAYRN